MKTKFNFLALVLAVFMAVPLFTISATAAEASNQLMEREGGLNAAEQNTFTISEHELLLDLQATSTVDLTNQGYTESDISAIKGMNVKQVIMDEIFQRSQLDRNALAAMGYNPDQISRLQSLTGNESFDEIVPFASASVTCTNSNVDYYYNRNQNRTYFIANFSWSWNVKPIQCWTDMLGCGWNNNYAFDNRLNDSYNKVKITYIDTLLTSPKEFSVTVALTENDLNTAKLKIPMQNAITNEPYAWAKKGQGTIALSETGRVNSTKFIIKYGHAFIAVVPTISSSGVSFTFKNAGSIFEPTRGVLNASTPRVV